MLKVSTLDSENSGKEKIRIDYSYMLKTMPLPFHPILFSIFPILFIFSNNTSHLSWEQIQGPTLWTLLVTATVWFSLQLLYKNAHKAAIGTSWLVILFFSYGPAYDFLGDIQSTFQSHWLLLPLWLLSGTIGILALNRCNETTKTLSHAANWIALCLLGPSFLMLLTQSWVAPVSLSMDTSLAMEKELPLPNVQYEKPNIFYIVLDAYGSQPALQKYFDFDNKDFLDFLSKKGFQVNNQAKANYNQTWLALTSSLNLNYVQEFLSDSALQTTSRQPLKHLIQNNVATNYLKQLGYSIICLQSGLSFTSWNDADILAPPHKSFDEFFILWFSMTPIRGVFGIIDDITGSKHSPYQNLRERIQFSFEHLPDYANTLSPAFIFSHILAPHPPFVFGPNGEPIEPDRKYAIGDGSVFFANGGTKEEYKKNYIGEVQFINDQLKQTITKILSHSKTPPIILIQADHGSRMNLDWESFANTDTEEAYSILHALYIPSHYRLVTPERISPVNNFRILFNTLFHTHLNLLKHESYYSPWENLFQFQPVHHKASNHFTTMPDTTSPGYLTHTSRQKSQIDL